MGGLNNTNKLPIIFSVACLVGGFRGRTCFAESWLRAGTDTNLKGAVAMYGASISQPWVEPMRAQDEFVDLLVAETRVSFGALCYMASSKMIEQGGQGATTFKGWVIFGDPSLLVMPPGAAPTPGPTQIPTATPVPTPTPEPTATLPPGGEYIEINQSGFSLISVDSEETSGEDGAAINLFDGDTSTIWHTEWESAEPTHPHEILIDLGRTYDVGGIRYLPRQDGVENGIIADYEVYVSTGTSNWGNAAAYGTWANNDTEKEVLFSPETGRYIRFVALSEVAGNPWTSGAELNVLEYTDGTTTPAPTATPSGDLGDVNGDGAIDIVDALLVAQFYVGLNPANVDQSKADVNCDGSVDIVDALLIAQYYVGLITGFC